MKQSIVSDAIKLTTSKIINMVISMITAMLLSRLRTLEEYGTYSQLLMVINIVTSVFMLGIPNSINFFLVRAESKEEKQKFISVYYTFSTILSFVSGLILMLSTPLIINYFNNEIITNFMYFFALYPWTRIISSSIENICIVYHKTTRLMIFRILNSLSLLLIILIAQVFNISFNIYMILFLFVEMIFAFIVYFFAGDLTGKIWPCFNAELIKKILHFSIPIGLASVVSTLSIELDKLIIGKLFNTEQLAIYTNAAREMPVTIISSSLTAVLMPQIIKLLQKNKNKEAINLWGNATTISYVFICFIATSLFVYAPEVISLLYSDKYLPGVQVFRVYSIVLLLRCTYFGMILNSIGKTKFVFYSSLATLAINVVFSYIFYLLFGFIGPAIATLISIAVVAVAQLIATSHSMNTRFKNILPWNNIGYITIINIFLGILFFYVKKFVMLEIITSKIIESIIGGIIWGGLYIIIMFKLIKNKWNSLNENHY